MHISGTNAKFSVLAIASSILTELGMTVGTNTSPDLGDVRQRIGYNLEPIDGQAFADVLAYLMPYIELVEEQLGEALTYFELITAMAFEAFFDRAVHAAVIETGLGGEYDATNVADAKVAIVTNVSLDHVRQFGGDLTRAAWEKAGIAKRDSVVVTGVEQDDLFGIVEARASEKGASGVLRLGRDIDLLERDAAVGGQVLTVQGINGTYEELFFPLFGEHQARNATLAITACEAFVGERLHRDGLERGLAAVKTPGRMEILRRHPLVLCDGGHNPGSATAVRKTVEESFPWERLILVLGMVGSKPIDEVVAIWAPIVNTFVVTAPKTDRAADTGRVVDALRSTGVDEANIDVVDHVPTALEHAIALASDEDLVLVYGSFYTATEARDWIRSYSAVREDR